MRVRAVIASVTSVYALLFVPRHGRSRERAAARAFVHAQLSICTTITCSIL